MFSLDAARKANAATVQSQPITAVFAGGTSGIAEYALRALVKQHGPGGPGLRIYIVGRKADSAERIFADCKQMCPSGDYRFVKATDLSLLRDVDGCCEEILKQEQEGSTERPARIDWLVMSQGDLPWNGRRDNDEGLGIFMSLLYYSRMRFIKQLLPLLTASQFPAHVLSIYAGGLEKQANWRPRDLSLRRNFTFANARTHIVAMTTIFFEKLAREHAGKLSLTHVFPGLVITPAFYSPTNPLWFRIARLFAEPLIRGFGLCVSPEETGERMLFFTSFRYPVAGGKCEAGQKLKVAKSTDGVVGGGAYSCKHTGEVNDVERFYEGFKKEKMDVKIWEHTMTAFEAIQRGQRFDC